MGQLEEIILNNVLINVSVLSKYGSETNDHLDAADLFEVMDLRHCRLTLKGCSIQANSWKGTYKIEDAERMTVHEAKRAIKDRAAQAGYRML